MELAWESACRSKLRLTSRTIDGGNFSLVEYQDKKGELRPCYLLTKTKCLYIETKFNDEARAKLVLRWQEVERQRLDGEHNFVEDLMGKGHQHLKMEFFNKKMGGCVTKGGEITFVLLETNVQRAIFTHFGR